jgi:anti-sigma B factor antagonist
VSHTLPEPFRCELVPQQDGRVLVRLSGELDLSTVPILDRRLREALDDGGRRLVIDLRGLEFMDSTGLTMLLRWGRGAQQDGYELELVRGDARVHRLFELTGLDAVFAFADG